MKKISILIRGLGVIGFPLSRILLELKNKFSDFEIYCEPYRILPENQYTILDLVTNGAIIVGTQENHFQDYPQILSHCIHEDEVRTKIDILLDCSPSGVAETRMNEYMEEKYPSCQFFIAQGSEHKFGKQILFPESESFLETTKEKFFHISTCNTHTLVSILRNLSYTAIDEIDFMVLRRDADMAKNDPHVTGPLFQIPKFTQGTHHSFFLEELLTLIGKKIISTSSAITVNSPYMHVVRFQAKMKAKLEIKDILQNIDSDEFSASTEQLSTNMIFSSARDRNFLGRIFSHGVWILPCLEVHEKTVRGVVATPGDSNVIFSTILSSLKLIQYNQFSEVMDFLRKFSLRKI
ncbi:MAG: hypothetical protein SFU98_22290 [Leptospiraceae bacterium]|nr:hypothetical protein [Leptospiraceae bacterium]